MTSSDLTRQSLVILLKPAMYYSHLFLAVLLLHAAGIHGASLPLFHPWNASDWVASDDTVRGGLSRPSLEVILPGAPGNPTGGEAIAIFAGTLDYAALNGSGFASQRTADGWPGADLSAYDRLVLEVLPYGGGGGKTYTVNVKDTAPARRRGGAGGHQLGARLPAARPGRRG